jgi:cytochrome c biogenesis protein CcmG/thiol:disulfide interchange protein DsbE
MKNKYRITILGVTIIIIFILFLSVLNSNKVYQPSQMLGKKIPEFVLDNLFNKNLKLNSKNLSEKEFAVLNIWASWCIPCRIEHPFLMDLKNKYQIEIIGINYKDDDNNAKEFLKKYSNPFSSIGIDKNGEAAIQLGAFGVPETYVLKNGKIIFKHIGPINADVVIKIIELRGK